MNVIHGPVLISRELVQVLSLLGPTVDRAPESLAPETLRLGDELTCVLLANCHGDLWSTGSPSRRMYMSVDPTVRDKLCRSLRVNTHEAHLWSSLSWGHIVVFLLDL
jgi:hypothetical protein